MAVGDRIFDLFPLASEQPVSNPATVDFWNNRPALEFDQTTQETAIWTFRVPPEYSGGDLAVHVDFVAVPTSGTVGWLVAVERTEPGVTNINSDSFDADQTITAATVNGTSGISQRETVVIAAADLDGMVAGDICRLRIKRDVANDTAAGDAAIIGVFGEED